jgi:phytol kinase
MQIPFEFWLHHTIFYTLLFLIHYVCELCVIHCNLKVNYTRKINHFAFFFLPTLLSSVIEYPYSAATFFIDLICAFVFLTFFIAPLRNKFRVLFVMFSSFDRPEDRPWTLTWLYTQFIASYLVLIPLLAYFESREMLPLIMIIIIANGVGDGLAEPVGIRFGTRKYTTYALFTRQKYVRSYAGSACVWVTTVIAILAFQHYFSATQLIAALLLMPALITLAEAFSPHTWDSPLIYASGGASLIGIFHYL